MSLLPRPWALLDVDDVEGLLALVVDRSPHARELRQHERDDLVAWLLGEAWILSQQYRPGPRGFSSYLYVSAQRRVVDHVRRTRGRTRWSWSDGRVYERPRPQFVSLDADVDLLGDALAENGGNAAADRDAARRWLESQRDRHRARDLAQLGADTPRARAG